MKNAFKCTLEELTIKCIFKRLVGVHTLGSWLQHSHDTRHVDFFVQGFFTTIFQLQKLVSKTYRARGQQLIHQM